MIKWVQKVYGIITAISPPAVDCLTCGGAGEWWEGEYQHPCPYCDGGGLVRKGSQTKVFEKGIAR